MLKIKEGIRLALIIIGVTFVGIPVFASSTIGVIDSTNKYAWGSKIGWINFSPTHGDVQVTDSVITGYAWNESYGWIHFNPTKSGVVNDGYGNLSGSAWSENLGWINFSGVIINSSGKFTGQASGDNLGVLNFDCTHCNVETDWRPRTGRPQCNNSLDDDGDGRTDYPADSGCSSLTDNDEKEHVAAIINQTAPSSPSYSLKINNDQAFTDSQAVNIYLNGGTDVGFVWLSETADLTPAEYIKYNGLSQMIVPMVLSSGEGVKTIYGKFCNINGYCGNIISDAIEFKLTPFVPTIEEIKIEKPAIEQEPALEEKKYSVFENVKEAISESVANAIVNLVSPIKNIVFSLRPFKDLALKLKTSLPIAYFSLPNNLAFGGLSLPLASLSPTNVLPRVQSFIAGLFRAQNKLPNITTLVSQTTPFSMRGFWQLMPAEPIRRFVFAPLPRALAMLESQFGQIKETFKEVGVERMSDVNKLLAVDLQLPSITSVLGLAPVPVGTNIGQEGLTKAVPIGDLSTDLKNKLPSNFVFARGVNSLVDFNVSVALSDKGQPEQRINTISGKTIELVMRPDQPVKSIKGYIVFKARSQEIVVVPMTLASLFNSLTFAEPVFAVEQELPVEVEERLVLAEFEYTDPDGDGLYTASVQSPVPAGEYEIITVIEYLDPDLGNKQIRMITVVDPEGYVFEKVHDQELRINGAIVTLYWLNPTEKKYQEWPAKEYQQENPQITDVRGSYSFLVPEGMYYMKVVAPGYLDYESQPFNVAQGRGVHINVEMKMKGWWWKSLDWKTGMIIVIALLLVYNFYKDKKRAKK